MKIKAALLIALLATSHVMAGEGEGSHNHGAGTSVGVGVETSSTSVSNSTSGATSYGVNKQGQQQGQIQGQDASNSQGQAINIDSHDQVEAAKRQVSTAYAPPIITSNDTCMGSMSAGAQGAGFGISLGTTWTDDNCLMLKNSREMWAMGLKDAAIARMCMDKKNAKALGAAGVKCPEFDK